MGHGGDAVDRTLGEGGGEAGAACYRRGMAGSFEDALRKSGLAPVEAPKPAKPKPGNKGYLEELSDDESLPPRFDAPALTRTAPRGSDKK